MSGSFPQANLKCVRYFYRYYGVKLPRTVKLMTDSYVMASWDFFYSPLYTGIYSNKDNRLAFYVRMHDKPTYMVGLTEYDVQTK